MWCNSIVYLSLLECQQCQQCLYYCECDNLRDDFIFDTWNFTYILALLSQSFVFESLFIHLNISKVNGLVNLGVKVNCAPKFVV